MRGLAGNALHLWRHLGLRRVFGIDLALGRGTAREIRGEPRLVQLVTDVCYGNAHRCFGTGPVVAAP